ncbi:acyltransferase [Methylobacterium sp. SyP6R]|nr:acyltransferase [Methylobacterium sp. SyP6R]
MRGALVVLVVLHHAVLAYCTFGHVDRADYALSTAPIVDAQRWRAFDALVLLDDGFFMPLLFLLSGLFVRGGLGRKGPGAYLRGRMRRLVLPFAVAVLTLIPFAYYPSSLQAGGRAGFPAFWIRTVTVGPWPSGPPWFLGVLLAFDVAATLVFVLIARGAPGGVDPCRFPGLDRIDRKKGEARILSSPRGRGGAAPLAGGGGSPRIDPGRDRREGKGVFPEEPPSAPAPHPRSGCASACFAPGKGSKALSPPAGRGENPRLFLPRTVLSAPARGFFLLVALSGLLYLPLLLAVGPGHWVGLGPFAIQASRVGLYAGYFATGVALGWGGRPSVLHFGQALVVRWRLWALLALPAGLMLLAAGAIGAAGRLPAGPALVLEGIARTVFCAAAAFALPALFLRFGGRPSRAWDSLSANSFAIYLLHYPVVTWLQFGLLARPLGAPLKGALVSALAVAASWAGAAALRRVPLIRKGL